MASKLVTVRAHAQEAMASHPEASSEFTALMLDLVLAFKQINNAVNRAGLLDLLGATGLVSHQQEHVQKLDALAHETLVDIMGRCGHLCLMASEEEQQPIPIPRRFPRGSYLLLFDPLDGSSNIDANVSVGTIFSIFRRQSVPEGSDGKIEDLLQPGRRQAAAGYVIYGSSTVLVYTTGRRVDGFTLDPGMGEFLLSHSDLRMPARGKIYSCNEGHSRWWDEPTRRYVEAVKARGYSSRYIGSLVADFHRTLLYGGIFLYPADHKDPQKPAGKLRLMYEGNPLALVAEAAGGRGTTGRENVLDLAPRELHQRIPLVLGSAEDVAEYEETLRG